MKSVGLIMLMVAATTCHLCTFSQTVADAIVVKKSADFAVTGKGSSNEWKQAEWNALPTSGNDPRHTKFKTLYSETGIYFLFHNDDSQLTVTDKKDFDSLWTEDVTEVFLWPDTSSAVYLEYEISPHNRELVLLIPNMDRKVVGWIPWNYKGKRKVVHETAVVKNKKGKIIAWTAEFFIPFDLFRPLLAAIPTTGTVWKGNFYRVDYDDNLTVEWSWKPTDKSFHEYRKFGNIIFE